MQIQDVGFGLFLLNGVLCRTETNEERHEADTLEMIKNREKED